MTTLKIDDDLVRQLAALLEETGLTEIEYAKGDARVRVARTATDGHPTQAQATATEEAEREPRLPLEPEHPGAVISPMVGVAYVGPEPGAEPFAKVGDRVEEGQTLVLIEAMKTFNPERAPRSGRVSRFLVTDGSPVEYGEALVILE